MKFISIAAAYSMLPLIFGGLMFRNFISEDISLSADPEELLKGIYPILLASLCLLPWYRGSDMVVISFVFWQWIINEFEKNL